MFRLISISGSDDGNGLAGAVKRHTRRIRCPKVIAEETTSDGARTGNIGRYPARQDF
jgi:hypothetical protein